MKTKQRRTKKSWKRKPVKITITPPDVEQQITAAIKETIAEADRETAVAIEQVRKEILGDQWRPIVIVAKDASGAIVATDRTDSQQKAETIAAGWRGSGWIVEIQDAGSSS